MLEICHKIMSRWIYVVHIKLKWHYHIQPIYEWCCKPKDTHWLLNIVIDVSCFDRFQEYVWCYNEIPIVRHIQLDIYSYSKIQTYMGQGLSS